MKKLFTILMTSLVMMSLTITKSQAQCEEIFYTVGTGTGTDLILIGNTVLPNISWSWAVCNTSLCYGDTGQTTLFGQFVNSDTVKVCLTATGDSFVCNFPCDTLVWNNGWINMILGTTSIAELTHISIIDNRMFDVLGREFQNYTSIPFGVIYIQNKKKFIKAN
jgi:hypothetical protein